MSTIGWRDRLEGQMAPDLAEEIDVFENQLELRKDMVLSLTKIARQWPKSLDELIYQVVSEAVGYAHHLPEGEAPLYELLDALYAAKWTFPEKIEPSYMWRDLERICNAMELPLKRPTTFPRNGLLAARVACRFAEEPWCPAFVRAVYRANFAEDRDIADPVVVSECIAGVGQPARDRMAEANTEASKQKLRAQTERALALGIFGAPTFVVGDELFWGNDRLEAAIAWWQAES